MPDQHDYDVLKKIRCPSLHQHTVQYSSNYQQSKRLVVDSFRLKIIEPFKNIEKQKDKKFYLKLCPQAQDLDAFGLLILNPAPVKLST